MNAEPTCMRRKGEENGLYLRNILLPRGCKTAEGLAQIWHKAGTHWALSYTSTIPYWNSQSPQSFGNLKVFHNLAKPNLPWIRLVAKAHLNHHAATVIYMYSLVWVLIYFMQKSKVFHYRVLSLITLRVLRLWCKHLIVFLKSGIFWILKHNWPLGLVSVWQSGFCILSLPLSSYETLDGGDRASDGPKIHVFCIIHTLYNQLPLSVGGICDLLLMNRI